MREEYRRYREKLPYVLNVQHKVTPYTEKSSFHLHSQMEIIYTLSSNQIFFSEKSVFRVPSHSLLLINSLTLHYLAYLDDGEDCDRYVITFTPELILHLNTPELNLLDCFLHKADDGLLIRVPPENRQEVQAFCDTMTRITEDLENNTETKDNRLIRQLDFLCMTMELGRLLLQINRHLYLSGDQGERFLSTSYKDHSRLVTQVCAYIDQHFAEPLSVDNISQEFAISKTQLYNLFRKVLRMSVSDYLQLVRMNQAKALLINTDYSVEIISQMTGYGSASSFSRTFKTQTGSSPLQYRRKQQQKPE